MYYSQKTLFKLEKKNIFFYYPSKKVGGAQLLFLRLSLILARDYGSVFNIFIIDFPDGFYHQNLKSNSNIKLIDFGREINVSIDILVTPLNFIYKVNDLEGIRRGTKIFFWDLHPHNLISTSSFYRFIYKNMNSYKSLFSLYGTLEPFRKRKLKHFMDFALDHGGVRFMCGFNMWFNTGVLGLERKEEFLPILLPSNPIVFNENDKKNSSELAISWLGRVDEDKYELLERFICDLSKINRKINLHIIGGGNRMNYLKSTYGNEFKLITIFYENTMIGDKLYKFLHDKIHIHFGIGTSVLEGAMRGIPSILGMSALYKGKKANYKWLYNSENKNLAITDESNELSSHEVLNKLINEFKLDKNNQIAKNCENYYKITHSEKAIVSNFIGVINNLDFKYDDLLNIGLFDYSLLEILIRKIKKTVK